MTVAHSKWVLLRCRGISQGVQACVDFVQDTIDSAGIVEIGLNILF